MWLAAAGVTAWYWLFGALKWPGFGDRPELGPESPACWLRTPLSTAIFALRDEAGGLADGSETSVIAGMGCGSAGGVDSGGGDSFYYD